MDELSITDKSKTRKQKARKFIEDDTMYQTYNPTTMIATTKKPPHPKTNIGAIHTQQQLNNLYQH
jgi:hypothetical protein